MRESIPSQVDEKSGVPEEENRVWGSQGGERGLRLSRRRKGQTFFSTLLCLSQYNNILLKMFLLIKNLLTNLVILKLVYCGSGSGKTFLLF